MPDQAARLAQLVRSRIAEAADPDRAERMRSYMKSAMPCRGKACSRHRCVRSFAVLWLGRSAVICKLHHKAETDLRLLREVMTANLAGSRFDREFFVREAVGWALRQHARTDPDWVRGFVREHRDAMSVLSRREALRHP